ncbi:MAG: hypothetical protein ACYCU8_00030 [Ferrimicrobium acidiphilum]
MGRSTLEIANFVLAEEMSYLNPHTFLEAVVQYRHNPMWDRGRLAYRDGTGKLHDMKDALDNNLFLSIAAIGTSSTFWLETAFKSSHPLVRASAARNPKAMASGRFGERWMSRFDKSRIVREAAKSRLQDREMRASNMRGVPSAVADLSVAYLMLLEQLYHLSSAQLAATEQVKELTAALYGAPSELIEIINSQLQPIQAYGARISSAIDGLLPKFQTVLFIMRQVENASEMRDHLAQLNVSSVDTVLSRLPDIMADAAQELNRLYQEVDIQIDRLDHTDDIERLLAQGKNAK